MIKRIDSRFMPITPDGTHPVVSYWVDGYKPVAVFIHFLRRSFIYIP